ncbi:Collagen alpha-1(XV) chain [Galemys pyrenaicus]|uniref:Collagen alpha-1(XV) chain n=1 Tax=Galemys pyrenaicus TaxID=202257 RepID=A0A8J6A3W4_GALPY|nr:Collagen alpha-1(XV) chain [Galemys pyrenaicus]
MPSAERLQEKSTSQGSLDLTELIGVPLPTSVSFVTGYGGFPAYSFGPGANVGRPVRTLIPSTFFRDFAISFTVKPGSAQGGVLFAITDPFQKVIHLGLRLSGVEDGGQRVILYYTEPGSQVSREAAAFSVPVMTHRWNRMAVTVQGEEVTLLVDCEEHSHVRFRRSSEALAFQPSSGVFVGNAGATGLESFIGSIQQLTVYPDPRTPEELCEPEESSVSGESSGFQEADGVAEILEGVTYTQAPFKEEEAEPMSSPPTPPLPSEDADASGEPVPEGNPGATNSSDISLGSLEPGKSLVRPRSGEILNDTLEGDHTVEGTLMTDFGSGDGGFIHVTEEGPRTEAALAITAAAGEVEVPVSTAGEAEARSAPSGGPTLAWSSQNPGQGVTAGPDTEEGSATGEAEVPLSTALAAETHSVPPGEPALSTPSQIPGDGGSLGPNSEEASLTTAAAATSVPLGTLEEGASRVPTAGLAPGPATTSSGFQDPGDGDLTVAMTGQPLTTAGAEDLGSAPPQGPPLLIPTVSSVDVEAEGSGQGWDSALGSGSGLMLGEELLRLQGCLCPTPHPRLISSSSSESCAPPPPGRPMAAPLLGTRGELAGSGLAGVLQAPQAHLENLGFQANQEQMFPWGLLDPLERMELPVNLGRRVIRAPEAHQDSPGSMDKLALLGSWDPQAPQAPQAQDVQWNLNLRDQMAFLGCQDFQVNLECMEPQDQWAHLAYLALLGPRDHLELWLTSKERSSQYQRGHTAKHQAKRGRLLLDLKDPQVFLACLGHLAMEDPVPLDHRDHQGRPVLRPSWEQVTALNSMNDMLQKAHLVIEGTFIYLKDSSEFFIRVRDGWKKLQLHLVALNTPFSGDIRADFQCFQQARAAGLLSTYRAFLSTHLQDLSTIVRKAERYSLPIVNLRGQVLFNNWDSIFSGHGGQFNTYVPIYSFDGRDVMTDPSWPQKVVWHGSNTHGVRLVDKYCEAWRTNDMAVTGLASPLSTGKILDQKAYSCATRLIVLCIENSFMTDARK